MLRIAICDDVQTHSQSLSLLLTQLAPQLGKPVLFQEGKELLKALDGGAFFDLLFMDIELGQESGIQLAGKINKTLPGAQIVFVTGNVINAVDVDEAEHIYFLTKPVNPDKLQSALNRALSRLSALPQRRLALILRGGGSAMISSETIVYCERTKRTTAIVCSNQTLYTPENLEELENMLPVPVFSRPHNSFLVNLARVVRLDRTSVQMDNGSVLSISNQRRTGFREALSSFIAQS